jgi:hypothetical protein
VNRIIKYIVKNKMEYTLGMTIYRHDTWKFEARR